MKGEKLIELDDLYYHWKKLRKFFRITFGELYDKFKDWGWRVL